MKGNGSSLRRFPTVARHGPGHPGRAVATGLVIIGVVLLAGLAVLGPRWFAGPAQNPSSPSLGPTATSGYYSDGIPRAWQGQPVLRGQAALDAASASTDDSPFYVAFWAGRQWDNACPDLGTTDNPFACGGMSNLGDQPGVYSALSRVLESRLQVDVQNVAPAPVIARVHTHDRAVTGCADQAECEHLMVGDVVWSGGETTAPRPVSVAQAAAAFGTGTDSYPFPVEVCPLSNLPGIAILPFTPEGHATMGGYPTGVVAVFPTAQLLAAAAPEAAAGGESNVAPGGAGSCTQMSSRTVHWLARANILVGIQYDSTQDPDKDPAVLEARVDIATLANR